MPLLTDIKNRILGMFPVIGTHMGIEADLLLAKKKPLGWISVPHREFSDEEITTLPADFRKEIGDYKKLEEAVKKGDLIARDVVTEQEIPNGGTLRSVFRHYAQPNNEKNLNLMAAFNAKAFNRQPTQGMEEPDFGKLLGYRKRDRMLWENMHKLPRFMQQAVIYVNHKYTRDAYQADAVRRAEKSVAKQKHKAPAPKYKKRPRLNKKLPAPK